MNHPFLRWVLDLDEIPADASGVDLSVTHQWPTWVWLVIVMIAVTVSVITYRGMAERRSGRAVLAVVRGILLIYVCALLAGPVVVLPREITDADAIIVLLDRSASLTIPDVERGGERITRDEQLRNLLARNTATWEQLADRSDLRWRGFHTTLFDLSLLPPAPPPDTAPTSGGVILGPADGSRTDLSLALSRALDEVRAQPVSGIVVMSDGRTQHPPNAALMARLQAMAVPVFSVPLGSGDPLGDLVLQSVEAPALAFVRDIVPVVVHIDQHGETEPFLEGHVALVDEVTGVELARAPLGELDEQGELILSVTPRLVGSATWRVELQLASGDLIETNNQRQATIELVDRPLRVLYIDGYPRWEYRYLKNLLLRERSIDSSMLLLSADRDFAQEGDHPITRLPGSREEMEAYDVIVVGDVPSSAFSPEQLQIIRELVAEDGVGLLWIGGPWYTPQTYAGTGLADLLPMRPPLTLPAVSRPVMMEPTDAAVQQGVLAIRMNETETSWPPQLVDPTTSWAKLSFVQHVDPQHLKPTAEVLAQTVGTINGVQLPLVTHMRYGTGGCVYVATDEIWRWRYGRGELLPDQFWIQLLRMLGRHRLTRSGNRADLVVSPQQVYVGEPVFIELVLLDELLREANRGRYNVVVDDEANLRIAQLELSNMLGADHRFLMSYTPRSAGTYTVRLNEPHLADLALSRPLVVINRDHELREPAADHALLRELAESTGGRLIDSDELNLLPELLPNRTQTTPDPIREPIWNTPLAFAVLILLLTAEWIGRRFINLA